MKTNERYCIEARTPEGRFIGVISGCGRNKGTWDSDHGRSTAYRYAAAMRKVRPDVVFRVAPV